MKTNLSPIFALLICVARAAYAQFTYTTNYGTITITGYSGTNNDVLIPSMISGLPVTAIGGWSFYDCVSLASITIGNSVTSIGDWAFYGCINLASVTIGEGMSYIGDYAFVRCLSLTGIYFHGNAPEYNDGLFVLPQSWEQQTHGPVYYLPGTTGWADFSSGAGVPVILWNPQVRPRTLGVNGKQFGFNITGTNNFTVKVEASTNLANPTWSPLQTITLTNGSAYFNDPEWTNVPARIYRLNMP